MKNSPFLLSCLLLIIIFSCNNDYQPEWQRAESQLYTRWTADVGSENPWPEYPRPQMIREEWINLNGLWKFSIAVDSLELNQFEGEILVPFPVESALSGVCRKIDQSQTIRYKRKISIPKNWKGKNILLHFEAVDWQSTVWIDGNKVGSHLGGYDPFDFDITGYIIPGQSHELEVEVWDPTSDGFQPRGKQVNEPHGIWYTPCTGIWQTVWLEPVSESYIKDFQIETDIDQGLIRIKPALVGINDDLKINVKILDGQNLIIENEFKPNQSIVIPIDNPKLWSPEDPFLYDLHISIVHDHQILDHVKSYFGMRKISIVKDSNGYNRLALNNKIVFQNGPLDQGFWPDGIYTPPSDQAMKYDIEVTKQMGFNMLRKHVKVENRRFYSWCDQLGILVWQDMPSASGYVAPGGEDLTPSTEHKTNFERELTQMIKTHFNHPSIVMWVPFNEGWGQYDTERIVELVKGLDSKRLVNNASGWEDRGVGDVLDIHHYPDPRCPENQEMRASVLGEFGGLGYFVDGHTWQKENWGYEKMQNLDDLISKYEDFYTEIFRLRDEEGLAACVYTQTTDVETETNGLLTYDRELVKMGIENIRNAHDGILPPRLVSPFREFIDSFTIELSSPKAGTSVYYTIDGSDPNKNANQYSNPITVNKNTQLKTIAYYPDGRKSRINGYNIKKVTPLTSKQAEVKNGLNVYYYEGNWDSLPDFNQLMPLKSGISQKIDLSFSNSKELFGLVFEGYLEIPQTGVYNIYLSSDDGGRIYLDENELIDYDGIHGPGIRKSSIALEKGLHSFRFIYFQRYGGLGANISWEGPGIEYQEIGSIYWKH